MPVGTAALVPHLSDDSAAQTLSSRPDITPGWGLKAPMVNDSSSVTCRAPATSNKVSGGQGQPFHLCLLIPLSTTKWKVEGSQEARAFSFLEHFSLSVDIPTSLQWGLSWLGRVGAGDLG